MTGILIAFLCGYIARCGLHWYTRQLRKFKKRVQAEAERNAARHYMDRMNNYSI